jgi:hypothetical protein
MLPPRKREALQERRYDGPAAEKPTMLGRKKVKEAKKLGIGKYAQDLFEDAFCAAVAVEKIVHDGDFALCCLHWILPIATDNRILFIAEQASLR